MGSTGGIPQSYAPLIRASLVILVVAVVSLGVSLTTSPLRSSSEAPVELDNQDGPMSKLRGNIPLKLSSKLSKVRPTRRDWSYNPALDDAIQESMDLTFNPANRGPTDPEGRLFKLKQEEAKEEVPVDQMSQHELREREFTQIYQRNNWGSRESRSGTGSEVRYTVRIRGFMGMVFKMFNIRSLLDSPCGDCNWQPHLPGFNDTQYTGVDIVKDVIEANRVKYKERKNMRFFQVDLATDILPEGDYDAVLCRDMVQHLPIQAGLDAYTALERSGARYLLTSFHSEAHKNMDIAAGGFKYFDPMLPPFNFTEPIMYALEGSDNWIKTLSGRINYKMIGLWKLPVLGRGTGKSITPINTAAQNNNVIVNDREALEMLRKDGVVNFACHRPQMCQQ